MSFPKPKPGTKHVETISVSYPDAGSIPASSTTQDFQPLPPKEWFFFITRSHVGDFQDPNFIGAFFLEHGKDGNHSRL